MEREKLIKSKEYWITTIQLDLFNALNKFMQDKKWTKAKLAEELGVTRSYITQVLNGDFDHKISKLVELTLAMDKAPVVRFIPLNEVDKDLTQIKEKHRMIFVQFNKSKEKSFNVEEEDAIIISSEGINYKEKTKKRHAVC